MVAPNTASDGEIGASAVRSSPATAKMGCGLSLSFMYKSPASPPVAPGCACLATLIIEPSLAAGGMFTPMVLGLNTWPAPRQVEHTTPDDVPVPPAAGQDLLPCSAILCRPPVCP